MRMIIFMGSILESSIYGSYHFSRLLFTCSSVEHVDGVLALIGDLTLDPNRLAPRLIATDRVH